MAQHTTTQSYITYTHITGHQYSIDSTL